MKKSLILSMLLLSLCLSALAVMAQQSALIDREVFFGNPEYAGAQISPDGKYISFIKPLSSTMNVWVKGIDEPFSAARPMTNDPARPVREYYWSRDSKYILFVQDKGGDENTPGPQKESGKLGVSLQPVTPQIAKQLNLDSTSEGMVVTEVDPDGAAAEAGISRGDVILEINRKSVNSVAEVKAALDAAGERPVLLLVNRRGRTIYVTVKP